MYATIFTAVIVSASDGDLIFADGDCFGCVKRAQGSPEALSLILRRFPPRSRTGRKVLQGPKLVDHLPSLERMNDWMPIALQVFLILLTQC